MKKITLSLVALLTISLGFSQSTIDFESASSGANWSWKVFEENLDATPPYNVSESVIPNPFQTGINVSNNVMQVTGDPTTESWGKLGIESGHPAGEPSISPSDFPAFTFDNTNNYVTMMVYQVGFTAPVRMKFAGVSNASIGEITSSNSAIADEWTALNFDMSGYNTLGQPVDQIIILPSFAPRTSAHTVYIDNISFGVLPAPTCTDGVKNGSETGVDCGGSCPDVCPPPPAPTVSALTPPAAIEDVLYIYSDAYTNTTYNIPLTNSAWAVSPPSNYSGPSTDYAIPGTTPTDNVRQFDDVNNAFIQFANTDLTDYKYFHIDVWSANATFFRFNMQDTGGAANEYTSQNYAVTQNQWNTIEIDLDNGGLAAKRDDVFQLILFGEPVGDADYYFDNIYFSKTSTLGTTDLALNQFSLYPNPTQDSWTVKTKSETISSIKVFDILGKSVLSLTPNSNEVTIDGSSLKSGLYFAQVKTANGLSSLKLVKQ